MKFKLLRMFFVIVVMALVVGCGGGSGSSSDNTPTTTNEEPVAVVTPQEEIPADVTPPATEEEVVAEVVEEVVAEHEEESSSGGGGGSVGGGGSTQPPSGTAPANKGPFKKDSNVTAYKLNADGSRSTDTISVLTIDDKGTFNITIPWTGVTEFNVQGEYLNEATGTYMSGGDLSAIVDMVPGSSNSIGINVFTHMAAEVMKKKMAAADANGSTVSVGTLKDEASAVIAEQFNLKLDGAELEDLDIISRDNPANAQLLQVSAALMGTDNPAETLANIAEDISKGDTIDEEGQASMADLQEEMAKLDLDEIEENIEANVAEADAPVETDVLAGTLSWDSNMSFASINDAFPDTNYTSATITVNGVIGTSASVSINNGWFKVNGTTATTVSNGDQIEVTATSSSAYSTEVKAILTIGGKDLPFVVTTKSDPFVPDTTPDNFSFGFKKDIVAGNEATSKEVTITGINTATPIAIDTGSFTVNGGTATTVENGDKVVVKLNAGASGETKKATVTIGGVKGKFTVSTVPEDKNPIITGSLGSFLDEDRNATVTSNSITVSDINVALPVSVTGGATVSTNTVSSGGTITVTVTAPSEYETEKTVDLHIGDTVIPFTVKTKPDPFVPDTVPNTFSFKKVKTRTAGIEISSEPITVSGINVPVSILVVGGKYDINGTESNATTISNGATVKLRVTSPDYGLIKKATLNIGGVSSVFKVKTEKDEEPEVVSFTSVPDGTKGLDSESNIVTISGINVPLDISINGGEYQIDGGGYTSTSGTIENNQTVQVKLTNPNTPATTAIAVLTIGNMRVPFVVTTADDAPVIADISGVEATEDRLFRFKPTLSEGKSTTWEIVGTKPDWLDFNPMNGELMGTPDNNQSDVGTYAVTIKATNNKGSDSKTFDITIIDVNYPPVLEALANVVKDEDSPAFTVELNSTDRDGTEATYSATSSDESKATVSVTDSTLTVTPIADANGIVTITVVARDVKGTEDSKTFTLTLTPSNDAPVLASIPTQTVDEDSSPLVVELNATDVDGDALNYIATSSDLTKAAVAVAGNQLTITPMLNQYGDVSISVKVNDGTVDSNIVTFTYHINPINDTPVANSVTSSTVEDTAKAITLIATDVDTEDTLTYSVVTQPAHGTVTISGGAIANYTPNADFAGNDSFTYKVNDGTVDSNIATVTISVSPINDAPVLEVIPPQTIDEDNGTLVVELNASDVDGDSLTYTATSSDASKVTLAINDNQLSITPKLNMNGDVTIHVVVTDSNSGEDTKDFTLTINPVNDAPVLEAIDPQSIDEDSGTVTVALNVTDVDEGDSIRWDVNSSNEDISTVAISYTLISPSFPILTLTPQPNMSGDVTISVKASDDNNASDIKTFVFTINPVNDVPTLQPISDQTVNEDDTPFVVELNATDIEGDNISYDVNSTDDTIATLGVSGTQLTITPLPNMYGTAIISVVAKDTNVSEVQTFTLTINPVNDAPTLKPISDQTVLEDASLFSVDFNATDIDGDTLTYVVNSSDSSIATATISGTSVQLTPQLNMNGNVDITVTATDGNLSATQTFTLTITPVNDAPILQPIPSQTVNEDNGTIIVELNSTDVDVGDTATYSIVSFDASKTEATITDNKLSVTPKPNINGQLDIELKVTDSASADSPSQTFTLTINPVNDAPTIALNDTTIRIEQDVALSIVPIVTDPDLNDTTPDTLTFSLNNAPSWMSVNSNTGEVTGTPTNSDINITNNIELNVTDGRLSDGVLFSVEVIDKNDAPTIEGTPDTNISVGTEYSFIPTANDPDANNTLSFTIENLPTWAEFNTSTGELKGIPMFINIGESDPITISVTDEINTTALDSFTVTVFDDANITPLAITQPISFSDFDIYENCEDGNCSKEYSQDEMLLKDNKEYWSEYKLDENGTFQKLNGLFMSRNGWASEAEGTEFEIHDNFIDYLDANLRVAVTGVTDISGQDRNISGLMVTMPTDSKLYTINAREYGESYWLWETKINPDTNSSFLTLDDFMSYYCEQHFMIGNEGNHNIGLALVGDGSNHCDGNNSGRLAEYDNTGSLQQYAGSWVKKTVNGNDILAIYPTIPEYIHSDDDENESTIFSVYDNKVFEGSESHNNGTPMIFEMYNNVAIEAIKQKAIDEKFGIVARFTREYLNGKSMWGVHPDSNDTTGEQYFGGGTLEFTDIHIQGQKELIASITNPDIDADYNITSRGQLKFYNAGAGETSYLTIIEDNRDTNMTLCWSNTPNVDANCSDFEFILFNQTDAQNVLDGLNSQAVLLPDGYDYRAINNKNEEVNTTITIDGIIYGVRLYADTQFNASGQEQHKQIYVKLNEVNADDAMPIIVNYKTHNIVVAIYNGEGVLIAHSSEVEVEDNDDPQLIDFSM